MTVVNEIDQAAQAVIDAHGFRAKTRAVSKLLYVFIKWTKDGRRDGLAHHLQICAADLTIIGSKHARE
jgi:hypothetical protein